MKGHLIRIDSNTLEGSDYPLLLASVDDPRLCHLNGEQWEPNIARLPTLRYDFFGGNFGGQITSPQAQFTISLDGIDGFADRAFASARVRLYRGTVGDAYPTFDLLFDGQVTGEPEVREGLATIAATADPAWLDTPLLDVYAGTGGAEGTVDITGQTKPLVFGHVRFADARLLDPVALIYQVHDGAVTSISAAYDRAATFGASSGNYASYALLDAATVPAGGWATCVALGLVRLGAPPDGRVAFDVETASRLPGAIIAAIASVAGETVDVANLDTARPYNLQLQVLEQTTARSLIQQIADSVAAVAGVSWTGELFAQPVEIDLDPADTLATDGTSAIAVSDVAQLSIAAPYWRLAAQAEPTFVVYALGEVATGYNLRGSYEAARRYRLDDMVFASDGRTFVYINATASIGNAPPAMPTTSNAYWGEENAATVGAPTGTTVAGRAAADVASTVAAGGGVDTNQVSKTSIQANAVTAPYLVETGVQAMSASTGSQTITGLSFTATIPTGEGLDIDLNFMPLWAGTDGTRFSLDAYLMRDGVAVETFGQVMDTNDMATNNQGGFAVPVGVFTRIDGNGISSTYSVNIELKASRSESNSGGSKTFVAPLDFRLNQAALRGRRFSR